MDLFYKLSCFIPEEMKFEKGVGYTNTTYYVKENQVTTFEYFVIITKLLNHFTG